MKQRVKDFFLKKIFFKKGVKILRNKKGFSLMEVLIAVGIMSLIAGVATPVFKGYMRTAKVTASVTSLKQIYKVAELALTEISAPETGTNFVDAIKEKIKGNITVNSGKYKSAIEWCVDIDPGAGGSPKGCVQHDGKIFLDSSGVKNTSVKSKANCGYYGATWDDATNTCTSASFTDPNSKEECSSSTGLCVDGS